MRNPRRTLPRRLAGAAVLLAAGAVPLAGAVGQAAAAEPEQPAAPGLAGAETALDQATTHGSGPLDKTVGAAALTVMPVALPVLDHVAQGTEPTVRSVGGTVQDTLPGPDNSLAVALNSVPANDYSLL
ncbi:ATP-binding protein [Streptomyces sp. RFCAC02]|uniref:ATP-binding protein n=1 Tax=Streptomyces sp. RFCAC02 TaxID=2499143 RepID=UPI0010226743|nr:ATP-binding protein [Streptomyces sp. RFCAC02]